MFVIDHRPQAHNGGIETHALPTACGLTRTKLNQAWQVRAATSHITHHVPPPRLPRYVLETRNTGGIMRSG